MNNYHITTPNEFYLEVGQGAIRLDNVHEIVFPKRGWRSYIPFIGKKEQNIETPTLDPVKKEIVKPKKGSKDIVLTDENLGKEYLLSPCCHPIPGDEVLGYLDETGKMHIHKIDCEEAQVLKSSYGKRIYAATWNTHRVQSFVETIEITGIDKFGVFIRVLQSITTDFHINIRTINISSEDGIFRGRMDIYVYDRSEMDELLKALRKIEDIQDVKRVDPDED